MENLQVEIKPTNARFDEREVKVMSGYFQTDELQYFKHLEKHTYHFIEAR